MVEAIIGVLGKIVLKVLDKLPFQRKNALPKQTLKLVLQPRGAWWHMGSFNHNPAMQIVCEFHATNLTAAPVTVTTAFIKKPKTEANHPMVKHPYKNVVGNYRIQPHDTTKLMLDFWITAPLKKEGETLKATIIVKDQFGNEHKVKNIEFKYR